MPKIYKNYISWCGKVLHSQWTGGWREKTSPVRSFIPKRNFQGAAISSRQKKTESKQQKSPRFFPPCGTLVTTSKHHLFLGENIYLFRSTTDYLLLGRGTTIPRPTLNFPPHLVSGTSAKATKVTRKILPQTSPMWHIVGVKRCCCSAYIVSSSQKNPPLTLGPPKNNPHHPNSYPSNQGTWTQSTHNLCSAEHAGCPNGSDWNRTQATAPWWLSCNLWVEIWVTCKQMVPICSGSIHHHFHDPTNDHRIAPLRISWRYQPPSSTSSLLQSIVQVSSNCKKRPASNSSTATAVTQQAVGGSSRYPKKNSW